MSTPPLDAHYWEQRWQEADTPWDMGRVSPALRHYLDQHTTPDTRILIPGAGRAYEAVYLHQQGYTQVYVCDWADTAFGWLRQQAPDFPEAHLLVSDFFALKLEVDLVLEQTFFCAIDPALRSRYAQQVHQLLAEGGTLAGLLFATHFPFQGPPFGGTVDEYRAIFEPYFDIRQMSPSDHSISARKMTEIMVIMNKRKLI